MAERVPTQFIDLKSEDFGPSKQEDPGSRISGLAKPPPTELIQTHPESIRREEDVLAELDHTQGTFSEKARRFARIAAAACVSTWTEASKLATEATRAIREAAGQRLRETSRAVTLNQDVSLHLRAEENAPEVLKLISGASIVLYPEIDAPSGWIAARAPSGELGYVRAERVLS